MNIFKFKERVNMSEKYNLVGIDGNAFNVMRYVVRCMRAEGMPIDYIREYKSDAMSDDYYNLLRVSTNMIDKLNEMNEDEIEEYGFTDAYFDLE